MNSFGWKCHVIFFPNYSRGVLANSGKKILFSDLCNIAECMSMKFEAMGVKEKMVISVCMRNLPEYLYAMLAALKLGAIWSPVNPKSTQEDLNHNYMLTKPAFVVTEEIFQQKIKEANEKTGYGKKIILIGQEEIISSSSNLSVDGKTGKHESNSYLETLLASAIFLRHKATSYNRETYHPRSGAPYIHVYPFFHSGGLIFSTLWPLCEGSHLILLDEYDSGLFLEAVEKYKPELFIGPPPVLVHMTKSEEARSKNLSSLKAIISGAMPVSHELKNAVCIKFGVPYILEGYGLTEASPMTHMMPLAAICNQKLGSCGVLIVGTKAKIVDVDSQIALPPDCLGELCIFGPQVMSQYLNNVQATSQTIDHDGWLHTGDLAYYDDQGFFYIIDRLKDLIICGDHKIAPADLEHILIMHDSIKDVAIIGVPNDEYGQVPMAFVVPKEGTVIQSDTVRDHIQGKVPYYKNLGGGVTFVKSIPRAASGKILRRLLKN